ncbi:translation initiation factor [Flagelloscypha sp. PMI_526]|nr:translation initiation factor [Flagelloscypha sp. PMI_526]
MSEPLFDPSLKKRKKKAVTFTEDPIGAEADPTAPAPETIESTTISGDKVDLGPTTAHEAMKDAAAAPPEEDFNAMFGDLKKKKKKKAIPMDLDDESGSSTPTKAPTTTPAAASGVADDLDFSDIKKKKKSSKKKAADLEAFEKELNEILADDPFAEEGGAGLESGSEPWAGSDRDYTYPELLTREGNKKSIFANVGDICKKMHRQPEHVIQFLFAEMGTTGSVDGAGRLVIRGRFQQKQVENVLRRYIVEYVTCKTCKSPDTLLTKENRIFFMSCESCGSRRSVNPIKSGFQAQVGKRSKNKTG